MAYSGFAASGGAVYEIANPRLPYRGPIRGNLTHGTMIFIRGHIHNPCSRVVFNLESASGDIALHVNPRFSDGCVVRNTCVNGSWGSEERHGGLPLQQGGQFECIILVQEGHYKIAFNGQHFTDYNHRVSKESVSQLKVEGDLQLNNITFQGVPQYGSPSYGPPAGQAPSYPPAGQANPFGFSPLPFQPPGYAPAPTPGFAPPAMPSSPPIYNPAVPFHGKLAGGMSRGREVYVSGVPNHGGSRFEINFQCGQAGHNICFHLDVRFNYGDDRHVLVGNSKQRETWGSEVKSKNFPFRHGQNFDIRIRCGPKQYKVFAGNQLILEFPHRILPTEKAVLLHIKGDVRLTCVRL